MILDEDKTKEQLINELARLRQRVAELETSETERKQMEEALLESQEHYRTIFQSSPVGIFHSTPEGKITSANPATARIFGYESPDELMSVVNRSSVAEALYVHPEKRPAAVDMALGQEGWVVFENQYRRKDGDVITGKLLFRVVRNPDGTTSHLEGFIEDITERKQAEKALRESEEFSSSLLSNSPHPILVINPDTSVRYVNPALEQLTGFSFAEVIGRKAPYPWWTEETLQKTSRNLNEAMRHGAKRLEELFQKKDGERFWVEITSKPVMRNGEFMYYLSTWIDITERKRAEQQLEIQRARFKSIFDYSLEGIVTLDMDNNILDANLGFENIYGYKLEEVKAKRLDDLIVPERFYYTEAKDLDQMALDGILGYETIRKRKDGAELNVSISAGPVKIGGESRGRFVIFRNITERKQAEEALRESEENYRELAESISDVFFAFDDELRYTYWNKASEELTGISAEDALGKHLYDIFPDTEATRRAEEAYLKVLRTRQPQHFINEYQLGGKDFFFEISAYPTKSGLSVFAEDITERKHAEEREKKLQQELYLSSRLASIGELAAGVAHEVNNPLTGILGFSQRLLRKSTDQEVSQGLEIIHDEALRAAKVVQNLLTFARRRKPTKEYSDINDIVQKALELRAYELETSNIEVITDLAPSLPKTIANFQQMEEVFLNIIMNAEQVMTEANHGGKLTIKTREIKDYTRISFADDGPGIPAEHLDKVFDPFFTTKEEGGGTGLGLSICHGIVVEHGGRIYARSKPGKGVTFVVELPVVTEEADKSKIIEE